MYLGIYIHLGCFQPGRSFHLLCLLYIPRQVAVGIHLPLREPVAHEAQWVRCTICDVEVFSPDIAEHPIEQMRRAPEKRGHSSVDTIPFVPALAASAPDKSLVYLIGIANEGIYHVLLGLDILNVLSRHLLNPLDEIVTCPIQGLH